MANEPEQNQSAWDARQPFSKEIVYRINIFNNINSDNPANLPHRLEALKDLFDTTAAWMKDDNISDVVDRIKTIEKLLFNKWTRYARSGKQREAEDELRKVFRLVMKHIKDAKLLLPAQEYPDVTKRFEDSY